jgi:hypothetical protein
MFAITSAKPANFDRIYQPKFIRVPLKLLRLLSRDSALLLSYLLNHDSMLRAIGKLDGDTFYVTKSTVESELAMPVDRQRQLLDRLEAKRLIRYRGTSDRWHVRIRFRAIMRAIERLD